MKIALCIQCPLLQHGGVEVLVKELVKGLHRDFDLYLVSGDKAGEIEGSPFGSMLKGVCHYDPKANQAGQAERLAEWGKSHGIDLFHFHHGGTYGWGSRTFSDSVIPKVRSAGFRCVATNHGAFGLMDFIGKQRSLPVKLAALCFCWPAKMFQLCNVEWEATVSRHDYGAVKTWFFPVRCKFKQIYHSMLDGTEPLVESKEQRILCLGTVGYRKGQQYLAEAFGRIAADHPGWRLVIAGRQAHDGTPAAMHEAIQRHGISGRVDIFTDVPDAMAADLLKTSAIFAMPSVAEGLGLSLQEAMFHGAACAGTSAGGITDMIKDGETGFLVPPADPGALAEALGKLMADADLRKRLSGNGRAWITRLGMTRQEMCARHAALYRN